MKSSTMCFEVPGFVCLSGPKHKTSTIAIILYATYWYPSVLCVQYMHSQCSTDDKWYPSQCVKRLRLNGRRQLLLRAYRCCFTLHISHFTQIPRFLLLFTLYYITFTLSCPSPPFFRIQINTFITSRLLARRRIFMHRIHDPFPSDCLHQRG